MKQNYWTYNKPLSVTGLGGGVASLSLKGASSKYDSGTFYPMFGVKLFTVTDAERSDISSTPPNSIKIEQPLQRAISFDTTNTTEYNCIVSDAQGCIDTVTVSISQPSQLIVSATVTSNYLSLIHI